VVSEENTWSGHVIPQKHRQAHKRTIQTCADKERGRQVSEAHIGKALSDQKLVPGRRPLIGPRLQVSRAVPNTVAEKITMASEPPSSMTGTRDSQEDEDEASEGSEGPDENRPPSSTATGVVKEPSDKLFVFDARKFESSKARAREETDMRDHSLCCPNCCVQFDCHEGCLGHPNLAASIADSETSSLVSMGIFDASFETSLNAVNKVLLEPPKTPYSKLNKIRTAFVGGPRSKPNSPTKTCTKHDLMKRTMRESPTLQDTSREQIKRPREPGPKQAVTAAMRAMDVGSPLAEKVIAKGKSGQKARAAMSARFAIRQGKQPLPCNEANEGRRVSEKAEACLEQVASSSEKTLFDAPIVEVQDSGTISMLSRMSSLIQRPISRWSYVDDHPALSSYAQVAVTRFKEMSIVVLRASSTLSTMAFEYKRTGIVAIPDSTSASELLGDCLRGILYLMLAACVYAMVFKVLRVVLVVLRIVLFPVKVCAWIIG